MAYHFQVRSAILAPLVRQDRLEVQVFLVLLDLAFLEVLVSLEQQVPQVFPAGWDLREQVEALEHPDHLVLLAQLASLDFQEFQAKQDLQVFSVQLVKPVQAAFLVCLAQLASQDCRDPLDLRDQMDFLDFLVHLGVQDRQVPLETREQLGE